MTWLLVAAGGALGSLMRHGLNQWILARFLSTFPVGIFAINVAGSFAIGACAGAIASGRWAATPDVRAFVLVGILGGFTTFSSFSLDTLVLLRGGHAALAAGNVLGQIAFSLAGVSVGYRLFSA